MKTKLLLIFGLTFFLSGCAGPDVYAPLSCDDPGRVEQDVVEETERGYPYAFAIYLPPCYDEEPDREYPVLYLFPGRMGGPGDWFAVGAADLASEMILAGELPPLIMIGVENTDSDLMADDFLSDMLPYAEANYRIIEDGRYHAAAGGSLGGTPSYRLAFRFPDQFTSVGMFGSGAISGEEAQIREWLDAIPARQRPRVFLNTGFGDPHMLDRAQVMISILDEYGMEHAEIFTDGAHNYGYWSTNFRAYLEWLVEPW